MKKEKIFWGLFFIFGAVFIIFGRLGYLREVSVFSLMLTIFFAAMLIKSLMHLEYTGILFSIAFLCIIYAGPLGIAAVTPWPVLGAALLGSIGCHLLFPSRKKRWKEWHRDEPFESVIDEEDGTAVCHRTTFGSTVKYVNSDHFKYAQFDVSFGEIKAYFDNAEVEGGDAEINVDVSFAGMELFLPKEWTVINQASAVFGAVDEKNRNHGDGTIRIRLTGRNSFGGVTIIYV